MSSFGVCSICIIFGVSDGFDADSETHIKKLKYVIEITVIMITEFINRESELHALNTAYQQKTFQFYPIYGRRRIGKTELIKQFIKDKTHIYFLATEGTEQENILHFKNAAQHQITLSYVRDTFEDIFAYITKNLKKKMVIVIDEFPFLVKANKSISSRFQRIIDTHLVHSNIFLILCGSSVGMMYKEVLGYQAPLYGRRTGQLELRPFSFQHVQQFLQKPIQECINIYGICGGIPFYLKEFIKHKPFTQLIEEKILADDAILNKEALFFLRAELDEIARYASIIEAMSQGNTKLGEIMNYCGFKQRLNISPYLNVLDKLGIITKETPLTSKKNARGIYKIQDNYFNFYFRFIRPNESLLETDSSSVLSKIEKEYNTYLGQIFEQIAKEFVIKTHQFTQAGRWWHKDQEIDIIGLKEQPYDISFFECKWKDLSKSKATCILQELKEKATHVPGHNKQRSEHYGIIARSIDNKQELRKQGYFVYDLKDWKRS